MTFPLTASALKETLAREGFHPSRRLGQNFLLDRNLARAIVRDSGVRPGELVLEVGCGPGMLTSALLDAGAKVLAVEIDGALARIAAEALAGMGELEIVNADVLDGSRLSPLVAEKLSGREFKVVSNLPYSSGTPFLCELAVSELRWLGATVMLDSSLAERIASPCGGKSYGAPAALIQSVAAIRRLRRVPREVFWPRPKVESALVEIIPDERAPAAALGEEGRRGFSRFLAALFGRRRKMLRNALAAAAPEADASEVLSRLGLDGSARPEALAPEELVRLFRALPSRGAPPGGVVRRRLRRSRGRTVSMAVDLPREPHEAWLAIARGPGIECESGRFGDAEAFRRGSPGRTRRKEEACAGLSFLDSSLKDERFGRYSVLAWRPVAVLSTRGREGGLIEHGRTTEMAGSPFDLLRGALRERSRRPPQGVPFATGAIGYLAYDLGRFVERLPERLPPDGLFPELHFAFYDASLVYDHVERAWTASAVDSPDERAEAAIERMLDEARREPERVAAPPVRGESTSLRSNFSRADYESAVRRAIEYIAAGDIFQVNLSQRFSAEWRSGAVELYSALRRSNAAPFAAFLGLGGREDAGKAVLSSSPERFLLLDGRSVETRPIKGTRPRGATPEEDSRLARELTSSAKDLAELTMIIDLERNDLGRVCDYGSVEVRERARLESYARVHHLVGTVTGRLHRRYDAVGLLRATFPGGSITGAPKVRAMEIIEEIERCRRSVYTGAIGCIDDSGRMDLNIAIRTMLYSPGPAGLGDVTFQVGGGIVADSEESAEYQESLDKARALIEALAGKGGLP